MVVFLQEITNHHDFCSNTVIYRYLSWTHGKDPFTPEMCFCVHWKFNVDFSFFLSDRESFPNDLQFTILMRFTVDQTQTPNLKVYDMFV